MGGSRYIYINTSACLVLEVKSFGRGTWNEFLWLNAGIEGESWGDVFVRKIMKKLNKKTFVDLCVLLY